MKEFLSVAAKVIALMMLGMAAALSTMMWPFGHRASRAALLFWRFTGDRTMSIDRTRTIEWDGKVLSGSVAANGTPTKVTFAAVQTGGTESADVPTNRYLPGRWNWGPAKSSIDWY
ncbi:hypothetical protein HAP41_0000016085 [Bradyrhizobium barranii subsp. apii]|uniref:Uncharacterized protein n=1 Tax=Bradyrhizobium barranii subsp. apii TaxID=2819348 RepID=A0A8T5VQ31_9BRAD|nr:MULTISPECIES: hypothetical protein [Bradyrhizobium]MCK1277565.1 hypothetical protein [Bradyrhizobium sp. 61]MCK1441120.1 hypothetical protein [Bradyrhizobium sp. 48]MCK1458910.1 hypothetical protein [Bradyrhizobium sp. 2]UPT90321.1 hypothetical protein HAP41_0000016085 [Bradyrhizobium barranii subsp. apii]UPT99159.1 hypothetical protein J4G48_0014395 [Bradyrhizobium barranii subsp. apii]